MIFIVWMYEVFDCDNDIDGMFFRKYRFVVRWIWKIFCLFLVFFVGVKEYYIFFWKNIISWFSKIDNLCV